MTKEQTVDWLWRLRSFLTSVSMPQEWRVNFSHALSDGINAFKTESALRSQIAEDVADKIDYIILCDNAKHMILDIINNEHTFKSHCEDCLDTNCESNPKPKTGHWIIISPTDMYCSECNEIEHLDTSRRFCAYCGAKMEGEPNGEISREEIAALLARESEEQE